MEMGLKGDWGILKYDDDAKISVLCRVLLEYIPKCFFIF